MFTAARYIAIDDDAAELAPLVKALHEIGAPCIGIHFDPLALPQPALFAGLRILFTDLHLLKAVAPGVNNYDTIASVLHRSVPENHGPYLLILWTSHEEERGALVERLQAHLQPDKMPLAVLALGKEQFRDGSSWDGQALADAIRSRIAEIPQLSALLSWEQDVLAAANATLALVGDLVPAGERTIGTYAGGLDRVLSELANSAAGKKNALANPRGAVSSVLAPLLVDRILNQGDRHGTSALWKSAVTFQNAAAPLDELRKGRMHRMVHFALPPAEPIARTDWGAVIPLSNNQLEDEAMMARFGATNHEIRAQEFKLKPNRTDDGRLVVVRGGAACDQAQGNSGPIPILLGLLVPSSALSKDKKGQAVHICPEQVLLPGEDEPSTLLVHARFATTVVSKELERWPEPMLRIREQLLMTILVHAATHAIRPGTLRF